MGGLFDIGPFRLDARAKVLTQDGTPAALGGRAVAVLAALVENANQHVSSERIIEAAWPGLVVEKGNLAVQISAIRKVLSQVPGGERWVETLGRRGYRFVGPVVPSAALGAPRTNLPRPLTSFIGRDDARGDLRGFLRGARLVTIVGTGGIGKTRLALQVAEDRAQSYRDGAWFVDLAALADAQLVPSAIAQALGSSGPPGRPLLPSLAAQLASREMLIVMDNCEHVLDGAAAAAETLLRHCGGISMLATSREPLRVPGEQTYPLDPLSLPRADDGVAGLLQSEAGQLFVDRLLRQDPRFELSPASAPKVAQLCVRLDGIPLALELAAARARSLSLEQILARLDDRFHLLTGGARTALPRQKTLRATLDWSYELLGAEERVALRRCAVFAGGFALEGARLVTAETPAEAARIEEVVALLVARSLVTAGVHEGEARYAMLETTRAYALEHLEASGEGAATRRRHARYCLGRMESAYVDWERLADARWLAAYAGELDNVRAALEWGLAEGGDDAIAVALAGASGPLWTMLSLHGEGIERLRAVLGRERGGSISERARLWLWFGVLNERESAEEYAAVEQAIALFREAGDAPGLGLALLRRARLLTTMGRLEESEAVFAEALEALGDSAPPKTLGKYWGALGYLRKRQGDPARARTAIEKALALRRRAGLDVAAIDALTNLADLTWSLGDLEAAADAFRQGIALVRHTPNGRPSLGITLGNLGGVLTEQGELAEALDVAQEALPILLENGFAWLVMDHFALRAGLAGRIEDAARLSGYVDAALAKRNAQRQANEARAFGSLERLLAKELTAAQLTDLRREGAGLDDEAACRLAGQ